MKKHIEELFQIMRNMKQLNLAESLHTLPHGEILILHTVEVTSNRMPEGNISISELAARMNVSPPAVSRTLKKLEEKGYIERNVDFRDRRNIYVKTTPSGHQTLRENIAILTDFMERVFSHLDPEEIAAYFSISGKLYQAIKEEEAKSQE